MLHYIKIKLNSKVSKYEQKSMQSVTDKLLVTFKRSQRKLSTNSQTFNDVAQQFDSHQRLAHFYIIHTIPIIQLISTNFQTFTDASEQLKKRISCFPSPCISVIAIRVWPALIKFIPCYFMQCLISSPCVCSATCLSEYTDISHPNITRN